MTLKEALSTRGSITGFRLLDASGSEIECNYESINDYQYILFSNDNLYGVDISVYIVIDGISYLYKTLSYIKSENLFVYIDLTEYLVNCNIQDLTNYCYRHFHYTQYLNQYDYLNYLISNRTPTNTAELDSLFINNVNLDTKPLAISEYKVIERSKIGDNMIIVFGGKNPEVVSSITSEYLVTNYYLITFAGFVPRYSYYEYCNIIIYSTSYINGTALLDNCTFMRQEVNGVTMNIITANVPLTFYTARNIIAIHTPKSYYATYSSTNNVSASSLTYDIELDYFTKMIYNENFSYITEASDPIALVGLNKVYYYYSTYISSGLTKSVLNSGIEDYYSDRFSTTGTLLNYKGVYDHYYSTIGAITHSISNSSAGISYTKTTSIKAIGEIYIDNLGSVVYNYSTTNQSYHVFTCTYEGTTYYGRINKDDYRPLEQHINIYVGTSTVSYNYYNCYWRNS